VSTTNACPECGARVPNDAPLGLCPRCLMNASSSSETADYQPTEKPGGSGVKPPAVDRPGFLLAIRTLELVPADELDRLEAVAGEELSRLARVLVQAKKLTAYQASAILQGKARGLLIGQYLVLGKLGAGGMGVVFKAQHRPSRRVVALKILPPSFGRQAEAVRRFRREFQIASRLSHPNLVAAIEASEDRGIHYLTMEYIPGYDLDRLVSQGGPMELRLALHGVIQVARGLEAAHAQGVIHRDVKPGNIMIDPEGRVRLLDLGLARVIEASNQFGRTAAGSLTQTGSLMGTVDFLAPEQAENAKAADGRSDIYSLGCTLYFLLTGKPPFPGDTVLKRLMAHQDRPAPSLRAARPEVPTALEDIYLRMMAKRPADRPQSVSEVVLALEACRTTSRDAGDVSVDLMTFARTIMKRAPERGPRGLDASVFARPKPENGGLYFDPDLNLEELVGDYRNEAGHDPIPEQKLPPLQPRAVKERKRRRGSPAKPVLAVVAAAVLGIATIAGLTFKGPRENKSSDPDHADTSRQPPAQKKSSGVFAAGSKSIVAPDPTPSIAAKVEINIAYGKEKQKWLEPALEDFYKTPAGKNATIHLLGMESIEGAEAVINGPQPDRIHVWAPASSAYLNVFESKWRLKHDTAGSVIAKAENLVFTPMVFVMWKERHAAFIKKYPRVSFETIGLAMNEPRGWASIANQPRWGRFKFSHTDPDRSNSGLVALVLMAYEFSKKDHDLTMEDITNPALQEWLASIERGIARPDGKLKESSGKLRAEMVQSGPKGYDVVVLYENMVIDHLKQAAEQWGGLQVLYPEPNIWSDHPYYILDVPWSSPQQKKLAADFLAFLMSEPIQKRALDLNFRPGNKNVSVLLPDSPFVKYKSYGIKIQTPRVFQPPRDDVLKNLLSSYYRIENSAARIGSASHGVDSLPHKARPRG